MAAVTAAIAAVGVGLSAYGAYNQYQGSKDVSAAQQQQIRLEQQAEAQRRQAMEIKARRDRLEAIRVGQRARALGLATATSQGATGAGSSGIQGAFGQISGQTGTNLLGITQPLEIGQNIFDINSQISQAKIAQAQAGTQVSFGQGLSSLGGQLVSNIGPLGSLGTYAGGFGSSVGPAGGSRPSLGPFPRYGG